MALKLYNNIGSFPFTAKPGPLICEDSFVITGGFSKPKKGRRNFPAFGCENQDSRESSLNFISVYQL